MVTNQSANRVVRCATLGRRIDDLISGLCSDFDIAVTAADHTDARATIHDFLVGHAYRLFGLTSHDLQPQTGLPLKLQHLQFGDIDNEPAWMIVLTTLEGCRLALTLANHAEGWGWLSAWDTRWPPGFDLPDNDLRQVMRDWMAWGADATTKAWEGRLLYAPLVAAPEMEV